MKEVATVAASAASSHDSLTPTAEAVAPLDARRYAMSEDTYLALYLEDVDLEGRLTQQQDSRWNGPDARDLWFARHQGMVTGLAVWLGKPSDAIWRLVDIRTVFPSAAQTDAWLHEAMNYQSEGLPEVADAPVVGAGCRVFGGTQPHPLMPRATLTAFIYVFRCGRVVVKLFAMQGTESAVPLTAARLAEVAERIRARIERVDPACQSLTQTGSVGKTR